MYGDDSKPMTFFINVPEDPWLFWDYEFGYRYSAENYSFEKMISLSGNSTSVEFYDVTLSLATEIDFSKNINGNPLPSLIKTSLKISNPQIQEKLGSANAYFSIYINPIQTIGVVLLVKYAVAYAPQILVWLKGLGLVIGMA